MDRSDLLFELLARRPLVCDGGMGTQLQALGLPPGASGEAWNVEEPGHVRRVHRSYLDSGADLLITNTFGGTPLALALHGLDPSRSAELNRAGARLARETAGERAFVLGDMGPFGGLLAPVGDAEPEAVSAAFLEQARALLEGGADALLVETMSDPAELALAVVAARKAGARRVLATGTFQATPDGYRTMMGTDVAGMVEAALDAGADVVGANCGTRLSLEDYLALLPELVAAARGKPVLVQPNAGSPELAPDGSVHYPAGHAEFAAAVPKLLGAGARIVGGCCGTGPAHIAALAAAMGAAR
jgi:5-methyltetrahydrofolate--homocysteine methyltransferase